MNSLLRKRWAGVPVRWRANEFATTGMSLDVDRQLRCGWFLVQYPRPHSMHAPPQITALKPVCRKSE